MKKQLYIRISRVNNTVCAEIFRVLETKYGREEIVVCSKSFDYVFNTGVDRDLWINAWTWVLKQAEDINLLSSEDYVEIKEEFYAKIKQ